LLKRIEKHRKEKAHLRGNDLRYNVYMRKLNKLTRMDLGLDVEAYKDYINNLKYFAHVNKDFEIFARDSLASNKPEMRELIEIKFKDGEGEGPENMALFNHRCEEIYNTLRKIRREASGFLTKRDKEILADFQKNARNYLRHVYVYEMVKGMYDKRQLEIKERQRTNNGIIRFEKVTDANLEDAGVSKREFENMKMLIALDQEIFKPSEYGSFSYYSQFVDISKYQDKKLSKEVKDILYRPPKLKNLYEKYW
jgi:hypothetical protein